MDAEAAKLIGAGLAAIGAGIGVGLIGSHAGVYTAENTRQFFYTPPYIYVRAQKKTMTPPVAW